MTGPDPQAELRRLVAAVHDATEHLPPDADARGLYLSAAALAERVLPGSIGVAVAATLALASEQRRAARMRGSLGESRAMLALALAVVAADADTARQHDPGPPAPAYDPDRLCAACGRPRFPAHDAMGPGPAVRHRFRPAPQLVPIDEAAETWEPGDPLYPEQQAVTATCGRCGASWAADAARDCPSCPPLEGTVRA